MPRKHTPDLDLLAELDAAASDPGLTEVKIPAARKKVSKTTARKAVSSRTSSGQDRAGKRGPSSRAPNEETDEDPFAKVKMKPGKGGCYGTNLKGGPCNATAMKQGTKVIDKQGERHVASGGYCILHDPAMPDARELNFGGSQPNAGPKRKKSPAEVMEEAFRESAALFLKPYLDSLGLKVDMDTGRIVDDPYNDGAKLYGTSKDGDVYVSDFVDLAAQVKVAELLQDRVFGKPKQQTELSGPGGGSVPVDLTPSDAKAAEIAKAMRDAGIA